MSGRAASVPAGDAVATLVGPDGVGILSGIAVRPGSIPGQVPFEFFGAPLGLLGLLAVVPLVIVYLLRPTPPTVELPTLRFLTEAPEEAGHDSVLDRFRREALFVLQLLALVALALALAAPYVAVSGERAADETVVVLDASASMNTQTGTGPGAGTGTRFAAARTAAADAVGGRTSVVVAASDPRVAVRDAGAAEARGVVERTAATDAPGDLAAAVSAAGGMLTDAEPSRVVVVSDFADDTDWRAAIARLRARGHLVDVRQVGGGETANVGITGIQFDRTTVTVTVRNTGNEPATRTVALGAERREVTLAPGDVAVETFPVPVGGGEVRLTPGDDFPTDDVAYVAAPDEAAVRVLVLTNDPNPYLVAALDVLPEVDLTVAAPPTPVEEGYDVIVFSNVDPDRLLRSDREAAQAVLARGGGVVIQAQPDLARVDYGPLLPVAPGEVRNASGVTVTPDPLTADIAFPPPGEYVDADLEEGRALVATDDGSPLVAVAAVGGGRVVYDGYLQSAPFKFSYRYPVFWKRVVYALADRPDLPALHERTGDTLRFDAPTRVETPTGPVTGRVVALDRVGYYAAADRRVGVSLLDPAESNVTAPSLPADVTGDGSENGDGRDDTAGDGDAGATVPDWRRLDLTPVVVVAALGLAGVELLYLRRRGDL